MYDIAVIGAGSTGASAALFTARAGQKTLLIDSDQSITKRAWMENHYGVLEMSGPDLIETGKKQAIRAGAELVVAKAENIQPVNGGFQIDTDKGSYQAKSIILATGVTVELAEKAGIKTKEPTEPRIKKIIDVDAAGKTSISGIWAAGACAGTSLHTIITAGDGAKVAVNLISEITGNRYVDHDVLKA